MKRQNYTLRDGDLSVLHFGDISEPVRLVLLHANGFNAQAYTSILEPLGIHAIAFDMRGHGHSRDMPQPENMSNLHILRDDCVEFFGRHLPDLTDGPVVLAGHSSGGVTAMLAAPQLKTRLSGYVGFDPVSVPRIFSLASTLPGARSYMKRRVPIARKAGRRKSVFESPEAAFARWQGRGIFRDVPDAVLRDYISGGLIERGDGSWDLACDPKWEQAIFVALGHNVFKAARALPQNSTFIYAGGRPPMSTSGTRRAIQNARAGMTVTFDPALGHLFPFIQPEFARETLRSVIAAA